MGSSDLKMPMEQGEDRDDEYSRFLIYAHIGLACAAVFNLTTAILNVVDLHKRHWWFIANPDGPDVNGLVSTAQVLPAEHGYTLIGTLSPKNILYKLSIATLSFVALSAFVKAVIIGLIYFNLFLAGWFKKGLWINLICMTVALTLASVLQSFYASSNTEYTFKEHPPVVGKLKAPGFLYGNNAFLISFCAVSFVTTVYLLYRLRNKKHEMRMK